MAPYKCHHPWPLAGDEKRYVHGAIELELLVVHVGGKVADVADEKAVSQLAWEGGRTVEAIIVVRFSLSKFIPLTSLDEEES